MCADWVTAGGSVVAALATLLAAGFAWDAANTWIDALQNRRGDECVAAASELRSAIHRCMSAIRRKKGDEKSDAAIWKTYTAAWDYQTRFRSAYTVARRYRPELAPDAPDKIDALFARLEVVAAEEAPVSQARGNNF